MVELTDEQKFDLACVAVDLECEDCVATSEIGCSLVYLSGQCKLSLYDFKK